MSPFVFLTCYISDQPYQHHQQCAGHPADASSLRGAIEAMSARCTCVAQSHQKHNQFASKYSTGERQGNSEAEKSLPLRVMIVVAPYCLAEKYCIASSKSVNADASESLITERSTVVGVHRLLKSANFRKISVTGTLLFSIKKLAVAKVKAEQQSSISLR